MDTATVLRTIIEIGLSFFAGMLTEHFSGSYERRNMLRKLREELNQCANHRVSIGRMLTDINAWGAQNIPAFTKIMGETERTANDCRGEAQECARLIQELIGMIRQGLQK